MVDVDLFHQNYLIILAPFLEIQYFFSYLDKYDPTLHFVLTGRIISEVRIRLLNGGLVVNSTGWTQKVKIVQFDRINIYTWLWEAIRSVGRSTG